MRRALVAAFANHSHQVQIGHRDCHPKFFFRFATGALVGRFAFRSVQFPAARTPHAEIWFLHAFEQQHVILLVETIKQSRNLVRQRHVAIESVLYGRASPACPHRHFFTQKSLWPVRMKRSPSEMEMDDRRSASLSSPMVILRMS